MAQQGLLYMGMGVSGGEEGARNGAACYRVRSCVCELCRALQGVGSYVWRQEHSMAVGAAAQQASKRALPGVRGQLK